ncbi:MAG TPA: MFS transporter [Streptosporangiaceae bacterium]|nr:MFS transporter [Streptosporangiaceae bacterium]
MPSVWRNQNFRLLWAGQTVSMLGSQVTGVAVPLLAVVTLNASIAQMGFLGTVIRIPFLLYLVAGVWVDRTRRRRMLIGTDLARGILLLSIPVAALIHVLTLPFLLVVAFMVMLLGVWFDTAYLSYIPVLVERHELTTANSVMETSSSAASIAGTSLGGFLVQLLTAPIAILADSVSYFFSGIAVWRIRKPEPPLPARQGSGLTDVLSSMAVGIRFVLGNRILAPLALAIGLFCLAGAAESALYVFYLVKILHFGAGLIGLTLAVTGPGAVAGAALAGKAQRTFGIGATIIGGLSLFAAATWLIPLAPDDRPVALAMLMVSAFGMGVGLQLCNTNVITVRQLIAPPELIGRVTAGFRFMAFGTGPFGSVLGGVLGTTLGVRGGLVAAVAGLLLAPAVVLASPVRRLRRLSELVHAGPGRAEPEQAEPEQAEGDA